MKAKITCDWIVFNTNIELKDGTIINVDPNTKANASDVLSMDGGMCYLCQYNNKHFYVPIIYLDIDYSKKDIDWERRRYEISMRMLQSRISIPCSSQEDFIKQDVELSIKLADELISQLKESEEDNENRI